jgi:hypothetical protein
MPEKSTSCDVEVLPVTREHDLVVTLEEDAMLCPPVGLVSTSTSAASSVSFCAKGPFYVSQSEQDRRASLPHG